MEFFWEFTKQFVDIFLHLDDYLSQIIQAYGPWVYLILFSVIFVETGVVIWPWLPGDSLLFAAGAFAAKGDLNLWFLSILLFIAAVLGDTANYWIGNYVGPKVFKKEKSWFFNPDHLRKAHAFYEKYGGKTIIIARFVPIVRTFAPFVAGIGSMTYPRFILYNIVGAALWVVICVGAGYFFGNLEIVKKHFELVILVIIFLSILPMIVEYLKHLSEKRKKA